jgi:hypothetical protein
MQLERLRVNKDEARKKGLCYGCERSGHLSKECLHKKKLYNPQSSSSSNRPSQPQRQQQGPQRSRTQVIRALYEEMTPEERTEAIEGFLNV